MTIMVMMIDRWWRWDLLIVVQLFTSL